MTSILLKGIVKKYGTTTAVAGVDLQINSGDLFFLLGPSGCGKTTLLRMIAGFIEPTQGTIAFGDRDVTDLPPNKRNTGMVFQSYALWPHMTVAQNVAYGLTVQKTPSSERETRVQEALAAVHMDGYGDRKPNALSGGQQQRVALARALVVKPEVLLLDEPLSNLDAKLRLEMRQEIRRICKASGITTVYVTHDQKEALSMADQVALLKDGLVQQLSPPRELYDQPQTRFAAEFVGETNFLPGEVITSGKGRVTVKTPGGELESSGAAPAGTTLTCSVRPECWRLGGGGGGGGSVIKGRCVDAVYLGEVAQYHVELPGELSVKVFELNPSHIGRIGEEISLSVSADDVVLLSS